jgi:hypothetical protein
MVAKKRRRREEEEGKMLEKRGEDPIHSGNEAIYCKWEDPIKREKWLQSNLLLLFYLWGGRWRTAGSLVGGSSSSQRVKLYVVVEGVSEYSVVPTGWWWLSVK